jgi:hypothetical protein
MKAKKTTLGYNDREGVYFLRTVYAADAGVMDLRHPGRVIREWSRAAAGVTFAIQVKECGGGWRTVDSGDSRLMLEISFKRKWQHSRWKMRLVAVHPDADEPMEIKP